MRCTLDTNTTSPKPIAVVITSYCVRSSTVGVFCSNFWHFGFHTSDIVGLILLMWVSYFLHGVHKLFHILIKILNVYNDTPSEARFWSVISQDCYTVIRFLWLSAKFSTCTVVRVNGTLVEYKMCRFKGECEHFRFNKCPIYTHDGASAKFSTNSQEMDDSVTSNHLATHLIHLTQAVTISSHLGS